MRPPSSLSPSMEGHVEMRSLTQGWLAPVQSSGAQALLEWRKKLGALR